MNNFFCIHILFIFIYKIIRFTNNKALKEFVYLKEFVIINMKRLKRRKIKQFIHGLAQYIFYISKIIYKSVNKYSLNGAVIQKI